MLFFACLTSIVWSQTDRFEGGIFLGGSTYFGDLIEGPFEPSEINLAYGVLGRIGISDDFSIKAKITGARITGDDSKTANQSRGFTFESSLYEIGVDVEWYFLESLGLTRNMGYAKVGFRPYVFTGVSIFFFDPKVLQNGVLFLEETVTSTTSGSIPIGAGFSFPLGESMRMGMEGGMRTAFSDLLDGVSEFGNPEKNDWYTIVGFHLTFFFD